MICCCLFFGAQGNDLIFFSFLWEKCFSKWKTEVQKIKKSTSPFSYIELLLYWQLILFLIQDGLMSITSSKLIGKYRGKQESWFVSLNYSVSDWNLVVPFTPSPIKFQNIELWARELDGILKYSFLFMHTYMHFFLCICLIFYFLYSFIYCLFYYLFIYLYTFLFLY